MGHCINNVRVKRKVRKACKSDNAFYRALCTHAARHVPLVALQLLALLAVSNVPEFYRLNAFFGIDGQMDCIEFFAGVMSIARAFARAGFASLPYDIKYSRWHDILAPEGMAYALFAASRVRRGGFAMLAPLCSPWVWLCRSTSERSIWNPLGNVRHAFVRRGNLMVSRVALILRLLSSNGVWWVLEQPKSSVMIWHPRLEQLLEHMRVFRQEIYLAGFGGQYPKPVILYSNFDYMWKLPQHHLYQPRAHKRCSDRLVTPAKNGGVTGVTDKLKDSQSYPAAFGTALCDLYRGHSEDV